MKVRTCHRGILSTQLSDSFFCDSSQYVSNVMSDSFVPLSNRTPVFRPLACLQNQKTGITGANLQISL